MCALVDFLKSYADEGILDRGLGDWLPPKHGATESPIPPEGPSLTSTAYYHRMTAVVSDTATVLERPDEREKYADLAGSIEAAFNDSFYRRNRGYYATGETDEYRQTSNVFPLAFDLVPAGERKKVVNSLVRNVYDEHDRHLDTGILGTKHLLSVLTEHGYVDLAYDVATQRDYPSWGHWLENGASALYEEWELSSRSLDHHMYGTIDEWFYASLAGIGPAEPGFRTVEIAPYMPMDLDHVSATVETVRGPVGVEWEQTADGCVIEVQVPPTSDAIVRTPTQATPDWKALDNGADPDTLAVREPQGGRWSCVVGPGTWRFETDD
jgi:alpha-L-rhamnosidase